ncbi:uncharacterized protein BDZ99DRAFT_105553 [Mytilinidion resinicola]|uniref:Uncharacterized protein n=1 Tax=Mytilinidion resinicola TaxID=574789 RepID=A0A6A6YA97_9PEZI|nr:uncharacterized protein BDZ99DRAFT_105553 [Mytilinidion resinicola]KAF2805453.1 hypothetical protein BDZ99DRAFT_105553 [Mytilinidion resinicola]
MWDRYKWASSGKAEVADVLADLMLSTTLLNTFMHGETWGGLGDIENSIEEFRAMLARLPQTPTKNSSRRRSLSLSHVGRCSIASLAIAKLRRKVTRRRRLARKASPGRHSGATKLGRSVPKPTTTIKKSSRSAPRPTTLTRMNTGLVTNQQRNNRLQSYLSNLPKHTPPASVAHYQCWKVGKGSYAFGGFRHLSIPSTGGDSSN